ncbi:MAG: hypothetical protein ACO1OB_12860 [Archangium sp.]
MPSIARIPTICATCQAKDFLEVGEEIVDGAIRWFERFNCKCGHGFETGGAGLPSPGLRNSIIKQSGMAEVWIDEKAAIPAVVVLLVRGFGLTETAAKARLAKLPAVAFDGSHVEAEFVAAALKQGGVVARVVNHLPQK